MDKSGVIVKHLLILLIIFFMIACGSSKQLTNNNPIEKSPGNEVIEDNTLTPQKAGFSVIPYDIDDLVFPNKADEVRKEETGTGKKVTKSGYRIQIAAIQNFSESRKFLESAKKQFEPTNYAVHSEFYSPNFKIYIGDFLDRENAKSILPQIQTMGFKDAFIVKANIVVEE